MYTTIREGFKEEMKKARVAYCAEDYMQAFVALERAHILGQRSFARHWVSHWWMLKVGIKWADRREILGQLMRLVAVIPGFVFGWVPKGNTGGAGVSPVRPMALPEDFKHLLDDYIVMKDVAWRVVGALVLLVVAVLLTDFARGYRSAKLETIWQQESPKKVASLGLLQSRT